MPECSRCGCALGPDEIVWCAACWDETRELDDADDEPDDAWQADDA